MVRDSRQEAFASLLHQVEQQGYITFDNIMNYADAYNLSIQDFDWLTSSLVTHGIIIYDKPPATKTLDKQDDDFDDYAQSDYEAVYNRIIEIDPSLEPFVNDVRNIMPPQRKELNQLKYQITEGNQHARQRMVEMHLRMALRIALQRAEVYDTDIADTVGDACIGLLTAVDKYDPDTNGAFGSYASLWMFQSISRRQPTQRPLMYYPAHRRELYFTAYPMLKQKGLDGAKTNKDIEVAEELLMSRFSYTKEQADDVIKATIPFESFEELYSALIVQDQCLQKNDFETDILKHEEYLSELILDAGTEDMVIQDALKDQMDVCLRGLKDREREIIERRYGFIDDKEMTLEEIGTILGITRERVRQLEKKAMKKLQHPSQKEMLQDFIDFVPYSEEEKQNSNMSDKNVMT